MGGSQRVRPAHFFVKALPIRILNWLNTSYQFKTEQLTMRLGAQFLNLV